MNEITTTTQTVNNVTPNNADAYPELYMDDAEFKTRNEKEFSQFLTARDNTFSQIPVELYGSASCRSEFKAWEGGPLFYDELEKFFFQEDEPHNLALIDSWQGVNGSKFILNLMSLADGTVQSHLASTQALSDLAVILIGSNAKFKYLTPQTKQKALELFQTAKPSKKCLALSYFGKVRAFQSYDRGYKSYCVLPQKDIFEALVNHLNEKFDDYKFVEGYYNHDATQVVFILNDDDLKEKYASKLKDAGLYVDPAMKTGITLTTSDSGREAVKVMACFVTGKQMIQVGDVLKCDHMNGHTIEDFKDSLDGLYAQLPDLYALVANLVDFSIEHPVGCMRAVGEHVGIPQNLLEEELEVFISILEDEVTALDIFQALQDALFQGISDGTVANTTVCKVRENLARTLTSSFDWKKFDKI